MLAQAPPCSNSKHNPSLQIIPIILNNICHEINCKFNANISNHVPDICREMNLLGENILIKISWVKISWSSNSREHFLPAPHIDNSSQGLSIEWIILSKTCLTLSSSTLGRFSFSPHIRIENFPRPSFSKWYGNWNTKAKASPSRLQNISCKNSKGSPYLHFTRYSGNCHKKNKTWRWLKSLKFKPVIEECSTVELQVDGSVSG